ncbi:MAG: hypothetical protein JO275_04855 [Verrucomicrobia bacterium]|nr:hypothetical protein [Verrucomicrobiota bacterium]
MTIKTFIKKSDNKVALVAAKPRIQALGNILPFPNSIDDLLSATKRLGKVDRRYEVASVIAVIALAAAMVFVVLNFASALNA